MEDSSKKLRITMIAIIMINIIIIFVPMCFNKNQSTSSINNSIFNIKRVGKEIVTQGDVVVYEFTDDSINIENARAEIITVKGKTIGNAPIKGNKILIDTSPLSGGTYKIKLVYNSQKIIPEDEFSVIVMECWG